MDPSSAPQEPLVESLLHPSHLQPDFCNNLFASLLSGLHMQLTSLLGEEECWRAGWNGDGVHVPFPGPLPSLCFPGWNHIPWFFPCLNLTLLSAESRPWHPSTTALPPVTLSPSSASCSLQHWFLHASRFLCVCVHVCLSFNYLSLPLRISYMQAGTLSVLWITVSPGPRTMSGTSR